MKLEALGMGGWAVVIVGLVTGAAALAAALNAGLRPWLTRYALARPSARGLHSVPTPQGGGIAVLVAAAAAAGLGASFMGVQGADGLRLAAVFGSATLLAFLGLYDDIRPLPALPRLIIQLVAMAVGVTALPEGSRVLPFLPLGMERTLLVVGGAWFINLTNFMDGMDWMTVVEMVPISLVLGLAFVAGHLPVVPGLVALGLLGGLLGYAPANRPVARLFLGDVGSLPIGFLVAYGLFSLAGRESGVGSLSAAVLLPLYYVADSGITLLWRLRHRHRIWEPHRSHFYQVAVVRGLGVWEVLARVGVVNILLGVLGWLSLEQGGAISVVGLALGIVAVALTVMRLGRGKKAA